MRRFGFIIGLITLLSCGTGCGRSQPVAPVDELRIVVCATVYPLADVVREIGGEYVRVDWILDLGDPITGFSMSERERHRLTGVDFLVCNGLAVEGWAAQPIGSMTDTNKVVSLETMPVSRTAPPGGALWLDPLVVREFAVALADRMAFRLPKRATYFRARADAFAKRLDEATRQVPPIRNRVAVTSSMFDPLLDRFGVAAIVIEMDPLRLSNQDIERLTERRKKDNLHALLLPFDTPPGAIADIEARTGFKVYLIDPLGFPNLPGHTTYIEMLRHNTFQLQASHSQQ